MKTYRGSATAARAYVEADRSRADDYYLAEGTGLARRFVATHEGVQEVAAMGGDTYERWVAGFDIATGAAKGRLRDDAHAVRFVEVAVNGPKTWSLAAALNPEIAAAYDSAQDRAAVEVVGWLAVHSTTRVGPRGRQVQVPVEEIEAAVVRHYTSRAGDPHRHLHLQVNARVRAAGGWRGLHTVGVRDSLDAINGIGHAAVMTDPGFRRALAEHGYHLDPQTGEVVELAEYAGAFSARARQIEQNITAYEAEWRTENPGQEPGPALRQTWDRRAWADARPDKVAPVNGDDLAATWVEDLHRLGFRPPGQPGHSTPAPGVGSTSIGGLDRDAVVRETLSRLGARRSAWNPADVRGEVEQYLARTGIITPGQVRRELAEHLTQLTVAACAPLVDRSDVPEHVRALTSPKVLEVESEIVSRLTHRALAQTHPAWAYQVRGRLGGLDDDQGAAVALLCGTGRLLVIEGAAGAGKTATLAATQNVCAAQGHRMVVVTPTRKAALVVEGQIGARSHSVAWLLHQHGYRWDEAGHWTRITTQPSEAARLSVNDLLVVDEAGMLDQDTTRALLELADTTEVRLALVGDRHQLPAVGRGGVLDLATRYAPTQVLALEGVHRFTDPVYADLSLRMRRGETPGEVFAELLARGEVVIHASDVERLSALAVVASRGDLVIADTREQVTRINDLVHHVRVATGEATDAVVTGTGERIGVGDAIATRRNDTHTGVANRETWTITAADAGSLTVAGANGRRRLSADYVREHVELAYATTAYGAQGTTVPTAHVLVGDHSGAESAYVAMTRGREKNIAHLVAETVEDAQAQWVEVFGRHRADLGPAHAARLAADDIDRYGPIPPPPIRREPEQPRARYPEEYLRRPTPTRSRGIGY